MKNDRYFEIALIEKPGGEKNKPKALTRCEIILGVSLLVMMLATRNMPPNRIIRFSENAIAVAYIVLCAIEPVSSLLARIRERKSARKS